MNFFERTLIVTPHFDDETIGCGGLLARLSETNNTINILEVTDHDNGTNSILDCDRYEEALEALRYFNLDSQNIIRLKGFKDGKLDIYPIKNLITSLDNIIYEMKPTAVLFPYSSHHQDHQVLYRASIAALRPTVDKNFIKFKAMYEYPYINNWSSNINLNSKFYIPLSSEEIEKKRLALSAYESQMKKDPKDILSVSSIIRLAKVRGTEIGVEYAEVFYPMNIIY